MIDEIEIGRRDVAVGDYVELTSPDGDRTLHRVVEIRDHTDESLIWFGVEVPREMRDCGTTGYGFYTRSETVRVWRSAP